MGATVFFTALAATGIAGCFALGLVAPLVHGYRVLRAVVALRLHGHTVRPLPRDPAVAPAPHLSAAHQLFASDTRSLLAELEHAQSHLYRFSDGAAGGWWQRIIASQSNAGYASTIGITGEVWRWLRQAEALADDVAEPAGPELNPIATAVRAMLFDARPLNEWIEALIPLVSRVDAGLCTQSRGPYRDRLPPARLAQADSPIECRSCTAGQQRQRYEQALEECKAGIRATVRRFAAPAEHADLEQDIRLAIWKAMPAFRGDSSLHSYVLKIARYRAITFRQRRVVLEGERAWVDDTPEPGELLDEMRQRRALARAIGRLPKKLRSALELRLAGSTYREIAERLAITEKNASVRVSRARQALKRSFCSETS